MYSMTYNAVCCKGKAFSLPWKKLVYFLISLSCPFFKGDLCYLLQTLTHPILSEIVCFSARGEDYISFKTHSKFLEHCEKAVSPSPSFLRKGTPGPEMEHLQLKESSVERPLSSRYPGELLSEWIVGSDCRRQVLYLCVYSCNIFM